MSDKTPSEPSPVQQSPQISSRNDEPSMATKLYVKEQVEAARGESLKIYGAIGLVLSLVTGLGAFASARSYLDDKFKDSQFQILLEKAREAATQSASFASVASSHSDAAQAIVKDLDRLKKAAESQQGITHIESDVFAVPKEFDRVDKEGFIALPHDKMVRSIPFPRAFKDMPVVFVTWQSQDLEFHSGQRSLVVCSAVNVDKTGFQLELRCLDPMKITANSSVRWVAIGH